MLLLLLRVEITNDQKQCFSQSFSRAAYSSFSCDETTLNKIAAQTTRKPHIAAVVQQQQAPLRSHMPAGFGLLSSPFSGNTELDRDFKYHFLDRKELFIYTNWKSLGSPLRGNKMHNKTW